VLYPLLYWDPLRNDRCCVCPLVLSCTILPSHPSTSLIKARRRRYVRNNLRSMLPFSSGRIAMRNAPKSTNKHLYCRNLDRRQSTRNVSVRSYRTVTVRTDYNVIVCLGGFGANRFHTSKICVYVGGGPGGVMSAFVAPAVRVPERVVGGKALNARRSLIIRGVSWALCTRVSV